MSDLPTHAARWQHRTHAAPTGHWHIANDDTLYDRYVLGTVQACETCNPTTEPQEIRP